MNDRARGLSEAGAVQRTELFRSVDELIEWKKAFDMKQTSLVQWMKGKDGDVESILRGCHALLETDKAITDRIDAVSARLDQTNERIDIVNKRLRLLEEDRK